MKTRTTISLLAAALTAGSLTSCVDTYSGGGGHGYGGPSPGYRPGYVVQALPPRYETVTISGVRYYRHDNVYYRPQGRGYVVVQEPRHGGGPSRPEWDNRGPDRGNRGPDWDRRGSDYRGSDSRGPDRGDWDHRGPRPGGSDVSVIRSLPRGYKVVTLRGERYYTHNNVYYQERNGGYVVVRPR